MIESLLIAAAVAVAPTPATAEPYMVKIACPEKEGKDGEVGTGVRIDARHAVTAYHVVRDGRCRGNGYQVRIVLARPELDFAIIETRDAGAAWAWGFDCSPFRPGATYRMGGWSEGSQEPRWIEARGDRLYHNPKAPQHRDVLTYGGQLTVGMSGGAAYVESGRVAAINAAYVSGDRNTSLIRLLADTPICDPASPWYRG